jgi:hypothetical protein
MISTILRQIVDERISFLKEQINQEKKSEVNKAFLLQVEAIRSADNIEKIESIISQKKIQLKNRQYVHESYRLFTELYPLKWFQRQIAPYALADVTMKGSVNSQA